MAVNLEDAVVVIVEDDVNSYMASLELLKLEGCKSVHTCTSGDSTMKIIEQLPGIDLFLIDLYMPGETGYDLVAKIRTHPKVKDSRIVALTASVMYDDIRRVKRAGFDSFIGKPVRPARFGDQVRQILAGDVLWEWR